MLVELKESYLVVMKDDYKELHLENMMDERMVIL